MTYLNYFWQIEVRYGTELVSNLWKYMKIQYIIILVAAIWEWVYYKENLWKMKTKQDYVTRHHGPFTVKTNLSMR